jgi:hypothetical protein
MAGKGNKKEEIERLILSYILKIIRKNKLAIFVFKVHTF